MKAYFTLFCFLFVQVIFGQDSTFIKGNEAYANEDYETALNEYNKLVGAEKMGAALYYNLGNTYYKLNELGEAIWAYERALKHDPSNEDAQFNLKFANADTFDEIDNTDSAIANWLKINLFSFSINFWSTLSILFSFILAGALYLFLTTRQQKFKNISLTISFGAFTLLILTIALSYAHKSNITNRDEAIIITEFTEIKTAPSETAAESFTLHEGTKVDLLRSNENWIEVSVNGNAGWVLKEAIWEI